MAVKKLLALDDRTLTRLVNMPDMVREFPWLASTTKVKAAEKKGCSPCRRKAQQRSADLRALKAVIAGLPHEEKKRLRQKLQVDQLTLVYQNETKVVRRMVF
jgi:hypothetical protein